MANLVGVLVPGVTNKAWVDLADITGAINVTDASTTALTVAAAGTDYVFQVDTNTASAATGIKITGAAAAGGVAVAVISSGNNEALTINAKGSGTVTINGTATGGITLARATTASVSVATPALDGVAPTGAGLVIGAGATSKLGFYGHAVTAQQTGVTVDAAGIHAACVALGLFTA